MRWLTEDAKLVCKHERGIVDIAPTQAFVTIRGRRVLVETNPEGRAIRGCPFYGPAVKPCTTTLKTDAGFSDWVRIGGHRVCLETVTGFTDGMPPGTVRYVVREPGQALVEERS